MVQGGPSFPLPGCVGPSRQLLRPPSSLTVAGTLPGQPAGWNYNDARKAKICTFAAAGAGVGAYPRVETLVNVDSVETDPKSA